ncbi:MAG: hypothetical protein ACRDGJ_07915 [Candidatus Limnocylindria bacterium]
MIWTSNYRFAGRHPNAVATSRGVPRWFTGRHYDALKPLPFMVKIKDEARFTRLYRKKILAPLDPYKVIEELGNEAILLCWEPAGTFCHRAVVATWLKTETGLYVPEW